MEPVKDIKAKALTAGDILGISDGDMISLHIPEWSGDIHIKTLTGTERDAWELYYSQNQDKTNGVNIRAKLAVLSVCDETGKRLFSDGQLAELGKKNSKALDRIFEAAKTLNKLTEQDIEELEKN